MWPDNIGDAVLRELCRVVRTNSREETALCRYGGDELAAVLLETPRSGALVSTDRIRSTVRQAAFPHGEQVTVSIGLGTFSDDAVNVEDPLKAADVSLYAAKHAGRNQVVSEPAPELDDAGNHHDPSLKRRVSSYQTHNGRGLEGRARHRHARFGGTMP